MSCVVVTVVLSTETLARVIRPTDSTHQPGKPIFSGRYHRRFFAARRARGRDQRAIPRQPVFISRPTYVRPRGCWPHWSQALRIRPLQRGGRRQSRPQGPCAYLSPHTNELRSVRSAKRTACNLHRRLRNLLTKDKANTTRDVHTPHNPNPIKRHCWQRVRFSHCPEKRQRCKVVRSSPSALQNAPPHVDHRPSSHIEIRSRDEVRKG